MSTLTEDKPARFVAFGGAIAGRAHTALHTNKQDAVAFASGDWGAFGAVSDGCGSGEASEVGALLSVGGMATGAVAALQRGLSASDALLSGAASVRDVLACVAERCSPDVSRRAFVADHLLATVLAFLVTNDHAAIFVAGDGVAWADHRVLVFDEANAPAYPGYALVDRRAAQPRVIELGPVSRISVATDGFDVSAFEAMCGFRGAEATRCGRRLSRGIVRQMRARQREGAFEDDAAIVIAHHIDGAGQ